MRGGTPTFPSLETVPHQVAILRLLDGSTQAAQLVRNQDKGEDPHRHEDKGLEGIGPCRSPRSTRKDVTKNHDANDKPGQPRRNRAPGRLEEFRKGSRNRSLGGDLLAGYSCNRLGRPDHSDEEVGNDEQDQDRKEEVAQAVRVEPAAEKLDLGHVAVALSDGPEFEPDEEETGRVNETRRRRHQSVSAYSALKGLSRRTNQGEGRHGRSEDRHEKHEGTNRAAGHEIVITRATEKHLGAQREGEQRAEVDDDDPDCCHFLSVKCSVYRLPGSTV